MRKKYTMQKHSFYCIYRRPLGNDFEIPVHPIFGFEWRDTKDLQRIKEQLVVNEFLRLLYPKSKIDVRLVDIDPPDVEAIIDNNVVYIEHADLIPESYSSVIGTYMKEIKRIFKKIEENKLEKENIKAFYEHIINKHLKKARKKKEERRRDYLISLLQIACKLHINALEKGESVEELKRLLSLQSLYLDDVDEILEQLNTLILKKNEKIKPAVEKGYLPVILLVCVPTSIFLEPETFYEAVNNYVYKDSLFSEIYAFLSKDKILVEKGYPRILKLK